MDKADREHVLKVGLNQINTPGLRRLLRVPAKNFILTGQVGWKSILNAPFLSVLAALLLNYTGTWEFVPGPIGKAMDMLGAQTTGIVRDADAIDSFCSSLKPVVAITNGILDWAQRSSIST